MGTTSSKTGKKSSSNKSKQKNAHLPTKNHEHTTRSDGSSRSTRARTVENFIVIWLDPTLKESSKSTQASISQFRQVVNSVKVFTNPNECIDSIRQTKDEKVFLIISGDINQTFVQNVENLSQLNSIYIYDNNPKSKNELWIGQHRKIKGIVKSTENICDMIKQDVRQCDTDLTPISIVSNTLTTNLDELDPSFMYSQLLKEILLELEDDDKAKKELVEFCREQYADNAKESKIIDEFDRNYNQSSSIWWYTRECFTYSMLNKALRTQDVEIIIKMSFFVRDLHQQIEQIHSQLNYQHSFVVYRGQGLLNNEFEKMKASTGGLISFNNFLSTSTRKEISMKFARQALGNPELTAIFFRMEIDPSISSAVFAGLDKVSYYSDAEKEILFSMHTVFRIGTMKRIESRLWQVDLRLTSDNDPQLTQLTKFTRDQISGGTGLHRMAALMTKMGELNKAEEIYKVLLDSASDDGKELAFLHHQLGFINYEKGDLTNALSHYQQSLDINSVNMSSDDSLVSPTLSSMGMVLKKKGDLEKALEHFKRALVIDSNAAEPDQLQIATRHNNIGAVLKDQKKHQEALESYQHALKIQLAHLPPRSPSLATTYNNIGLVYSAMGDKSTAVSYYKKALEIFQRSLTPYHHSLAIIHRNIARALEDLHQCNEAAKYANQAVIISRRAFGPDHSETKINQEDLDRLQQKL